MIFKNWWKFAGAVLVLYSLIAGMLLPVPALDILNESIRNLYYHVTMWFAMLMLLTVSVIYSIKYLGNQKEYSDVVASQSASVAVLFAAAGLFTGMIWARFTWGAFWVNDPKLNGVAASMLVYAAYFVLRSSMDDEVKRARFSAVYNIFAYVMTLLFIMILPRLTASLHPGNGGNPGFSTYDLDSQMRWIFYPAVLGWIFIGVWILSLRVRLKVIGLKSDL